MKKLISLIVISLLVVTIMATMMGCPSPIKNLDHIPQITIDLPATQSVEVGQSITLSVVATDEDGDPLDYMWDESSDNGATWVGIDVNSSSYTFSKSSAGTWKVKVIVDDGKGGSVTSTICTITVTTTPPTNHNPTITTDLPATKSAQTGESITLSVVATDQDGDTLSYAWKESSDGTTWNTVGSNSSSYTFSKSSAGTWKVKVIVDDGKGGSVTSTICTITVSSTPPAVYTVYTAYGTKLYDISDPGTVKFFSAWGTSTTAGVIVK